MATWIYCDYHNASIDPSQPNNGLPINDQPVNLDLCETIKREGVHRMNEHQLIFYFQKSEPVIWRFINAALRDLEYDRAIQLMKESSEKPQK